MAHILSPVGPVLGFRRDGRPILQVRGGDGSVLDLTTATPDELRAEQARLMAELDAPGADVGTIAERATAVVAAITAHNDRVAAAEQARAALAGATVSRSAGRPASQGGGQARPAGNGQGSTDDGADSAHERQDGRQRWAERIATDASVRAYTSAGAHGQVQLTIPGEVRSLFGTSAYPILPQIVPGVMQPNRDVPLTVLDMIDRQPMTSNVVEWVQEDTPPTGQAAETAEGSTKPETQFAVSLQTSVAATIAHWINITRQVLSDEVMLQGYLEGRMTYGLMWRLQTQVISGNGTAPNLRGIQNTTGRGTYTAVAAEQALISVRKAKTVAQLSQYDPDTVVMNPQDWQTIELTTATGSGVFQIAQPSATTPARLWGLTVITHTSMTATVAGTSGGRFLVGSFRIGATLWERNGVELYITDSHASNFTANILTLLAEMRCALSVWRPKAFVDGTFGQTGN